MPKWTAQQKKVIETRNKNILVSAAAGSGKTAVLVERIIQEILDEEQGINVDKLLVVTFTNAAAGEMRERILKAIELELEKHPDNEHLQKQQSYIHNASITTIHSFCLNLIREHFIDIDLDPGFKVAETNEIELLKGDVMKELLEEEYEAAAPEFLDFADQFTVRNSDREIEKMVLTLYEKVLGYPWPEQWLRQSIALYSVRDKEEFMSSPNFLTLTAYTDELLKLAIMKCEYGRKISMSINGPEKYGRIFEMDMQNLESVLQEKDFDKRRSLLCFAFDRLPRISASDGTDEEKKTQAQSVRKEVKAAVSEIQKIYASSLEDFIAGLNQLEPAAKEYVRLTLRFMDLFRKKKREKNIVDFNDFEQFAVEILTRMEDGRLVPSKTAEELSEFYEEIMVDEYQDSNMIQETILGMISKEGKGIHNRFMVGDVKQSIYGFRGARPDIFIRKYNTYSMDGAKDIKIILDRNFRSRSVVLDFINVLFRQNMSADFGGIDYDEENQLNAGAEYEIPGVAEDYNSELILVNPEEEEETDEEIPGMADEMEAKVIAARIKELVDDKKGLQVRDAGTGAYRTARYSDIVILVRSVNEAVYAVNEELTKQGIPVYMESKRGYFDTIEIRTILNFLKIVDNPRQDIPLAAVLKSPAAGFSDEELAMVRAVSGKDKNLYDNLLECEWNIYQMEEQSLSEQEKAVFQPELDQKISNFLLLLEKFRNMASYTGIYDLINLFLNETGYYDYIKAMPSGRRRCVNVDMLKEQAARYENGVYKGLFNFVRYIEKMQKFELDMGEASVVSESDNTVRIMTIHKSKGLEFPVVFLINITKQFNLMDSRSKTVLHHQLGIGMDYVDVRKRLLRKNMNKFLIARRMELDTVTEELRLLYVACTRAKEKLIFTAKSVNRKKLEQATEARMYDTEVLPYAVRMKARSFFDMICPALCRNRAFAPVYDRLGMEAPADLALYDRNFHVDIIYVTPTDIFTEMIEQQYMKKGNREALENLATEVTGNQMLRQELIRRLDFTYPYEKETGMNAKMSVSEIKKISYETEEDTQAVRLVEMLPELSEQPEEDIFQKKTPRETVSLESPALENPTIPEFIKARDRLTGALRGTVYHRVFELFDFGQEHTLSSIQAMVQGFAEAGMLTKEERECIRDRDFLIFAESDLGKRMKAAFERGELHREAQFVLGLYESEIEEFKRVAEIMGKEQRMEIPQSVEPAGDIVLIQGIIDAYFIEGNEIIIADYKTDFVREPSLLINHYYVQLELYKRAVEQITGKSVTEKILYSVTLGKEVTLK